MHPTYQTSRAQTTPPSPNFPLFDPTSSHSPLSAGVEGTAVPLPALRRIPLSFIPTCGIIISTPKHTGLPQPLPRGGEFCCHPPARQLQFNSPLLPLDFMPIIEYHLGMTEIENLTAFGDARKRRYRYIDKYIDTLIHESTYQHISYNI